jgi:hypothetical protein
MMMLTAVLIEAFEAAFALEVFEVAANCAFAKNAFVGWDSGVEMGTDR